mmetsp:Transcript_87209/g.138369  ORF Transcript_87209/g.138369 Transcript_87209/m.138369 type:complete len:202 (-) Transcript_87209:213-818(-)
MMVRVLLRFPEQSGVHLLQSCQSLITQSTGQFSELQSSVCFFSESLHSVPPLSPSCLTPLVRDFDPPPQDSLHSDHFSQSAYSQSCGASSSSNSSPCFEAFVSVSTSCTFTVWEISFLEERPVARFLLASCLTFLATEPSLSTVAECWPWCFFRPLSTCKSSSGPVVSSAICSVCSCKFPTRSFKPSDRRSRLKCLEPACT